VQIAVWLWFTVLFANFAEALAEGRGKARADSLKAGSQGLSARRKPAMAATSGAGQPACARAMWCASKPAR
jgi:high-affinity K+ transport system ATPase subunit B